MRPTYDEFLRSAAKWRGEHNGITFELSWHGASDYSPQGTWCWYITVRSEEFNADDWALLRLSKEDKQLLGSWRRHWDYYSFPDLEAHGGWTYGEMGNYLGRDGTEQEFVKVGCDYAHLWDSERGFPEGFGAIERDVKHSIDLLCKMFPNRRLRCAYSGQYDDAEQFYTARNGATVHKSQRGNFSEGNWSSWLPKEEVNV